MDLIFIKQNKQGILMNFYSSELICATNTVLYMMN